jgi:non-heme chloroperoxidase
MFSTLKEIIPGPFAIPLYTETYGDPQARLSLVCIHGGLQSLRCFRRQYAALAEHAYVIAFDLPYHGQSGPVPAHVQPSPALWAQSVRAVLTHLQREEAPLFILAWSFGGLVAQHYLCTYGQKDVSGLILVDSLFGGASTFQPFQSPLAAQVTATMMTTSVSLPERVRAFEHFVRMLTLRPLPPEEADAQYGSNAKAFLRSLATTTSWMAELPSDQQDFLCRLQMPVLLLQGKDDALVAPTYTRQIAHCIKRAQVLEYEDCGHSPFLEQPLRFNQDVVAFLHEHATKGGAYHVVAQRSPQVQAEERARASVADAASRVSRVGNTKEETVMGASIPKREREAS